MKRYCFILFLVAMSVSVLADNYGCTREKMSHEKFQEEKKKFLMEKAGLTSEEAVVFFPVYFELQQEKKKINDAMWQRVKKAKKQRLSEAEYEEIILQVYDTRISVDELEKRYFEKFKKIISCEKIFRIQQAELKFSRNLIRNMCNYGVDSKSSHK